jgi:hypothetical protein
MTLTSIFVLLVMIWSPDGSIELIMGGMYDSIGKCRQKAHERVLQSIFEGPQDVAIDSMCVQFVKELAPIQP